MLVVVAPADFLAADLLVADFLVADLLVADFLVADPLVADFLAAGLLAADLLAPEPWPHRKLIRRPRWRDSLCWLVGLPYCEADVGNRTALADVCRQNARADAGVLIYAQAIKWPCECQ